MSFMPKEIKYCSLDIETSGFDPLKDEILEVGFAFFTVTSDGIRVVEEWAQVFKPKMPVEPKILGLTGITQKELDEAPSFNEHREFIQNKLENAIVVGHNVSFDIKFLQAFGIRFSGQIIDTLDLVQFILPTHHSYNLENLMHYFQVPHEEAHRALADAKAVLKMLEKLLKVYSTFPEKLRREIRAIIKPFNFAWEEFLRIKLRENLSNSLFSRLFPSVEKEKAKNNQLAPCLLLFTPHAIYNFPLGEDYLPQVLAALLSLRSKSLLVLPKKQQFMNLWQQGRVRAIFEEQDLFNEEKFEAFLKKKNLSPEEVKFLLKVLVWKNTNWQTETILDLNLSFFGGQFKSLVCGKKITADKKSKILICDHRTFLNLAKQKLFKDRLIVIAGLAEFEAAVSSDISRKVSWGYVGFVLKSFYNPETNTGSLKYKELIIDLLSKTDLFFGLVNALLQTSPPTFLYYKISKEVLDLEDFQKIKKAAGNYLARLKETNGILQSKDLEEVANNLNDFFTEEDNRVKWIELSENRCIFQNCPIRLEGLVKKLTSPYRKIAFIDSLGIKKLYDLFITRLGLRNFEVEDVKQKLGIKPKKHLLQKDLFSGINNKEMQKINCWIKLKALVDKEILEFLQKEFLPAAVLFALPSQIKEFYDANFLWLQKYAYLLTQNHSGGSNKIFRNFGIYRESILLVTDKFILRFLIDNQNTTSLQKLVVKALIINHLPFEQFTHPYLEAVAEDFQNPFEEFSLPRAVYNLHRIIQFFYTEELESIIIADPKLNKDYSRAFIEYLKSIPRIEIRQ